MKKLLYTTAISFLLTVHSVIPYEQEVLDPQGLEILNKEWKFSHDDGKTYIPIEVGKALSIQGIQSPVKGDYQLKFKILNPNIDESIGLYLGRIKDVDTVRINGVIIGSTGSCSEGEVYNPNWFVKRLYTIPLSTLKVPGENEIQVHVCSKILGMEAGIYKEIPMFGKYSLLNARLIKEELISFSIIIFFFGIMLYQIIIFLLRRDAFPSLALSVACLVYIIWQLHGLNTFNELFNHGRIYIHFYFFSMCIFPAILMNFTYSLLGLGFGKWEKTLLILCIVIPTINLFTPNIMFYKHLLFAWKFIVFPMIYFVIKSIIISLKNNSREAVFLTIGHTIGIIFGFVDIYFSFTSGATYNLTQFGFLAIVASSSASISYRNATIHREIKKINSNLEQTVLERTQELSTKNKILENDIFLAGNLQSQLIPQIKPKSDHIQIESIYIPYDRVGGDYWDWEKIDDKKYGVIICDVLGHGIPAAFIASMIKVSFTELVKKFNSPDKLLEKLNSQLTNLINGYFITAIYAIFDLESKKLSYSVAGHSPPIFFRNGTAFSMEGKGNLVGWDENTKFSLFEKEIKQGDRFLFYTDGLVECMNEKEELFGDTRLLRMLTSTQDFRLSEISSKIIQEVMMFSSMNKLQDDLTYFLVEIIDADSS